MLGAKSKDPANAVTQRGNTKPLAKNDTFLWRFYTLLVLKTTAKLYRGEGLCVPISKNKIVKRGPFVNLTEAATMTFVAQNTSLPVPKVYCSFVYKGRAYIVMERIRGEVIPGAWERLSERSRQTIFTEPKRMMCELRAVKPPPGTRVESCVGGTLYDSRIARAIYRFGPFTTIQEFHLWLRDNLQPSKSKDYTCSDHEWLEIKQMATKQDGPWPPPVFTHGDLNPFNILVRDGSVVGIIDWEFSGWYPHYWEYTSAWYGNLTRTAWQDMLGNFLDPCPEELDMETVRQKWWGEV